MIHLILILVVVGVLLCALCTYVPMDPTIKKIITAVVVICVIAYVLQAFGLWGSAHDVPVPNLKQA